MRHSTCCRRDQRSAGHCCTVRPSRTGFTLIELTVSFGVILVLLSLALPAFRETRRAAERVEFMNEARQNGIAGASYSASNLGRFPIYSSTEGHPISNTGGWWYEVYRTGHLTEDEVNQLNSSKYMQSVATALESHKMIPGRTTPWHDLTTDVITTSRVQGPSGLGILSARGFPDGNPLAPWCCDTSGHMPAPEAPVYFADGSVGMYRWIDLLYVTSSDDPLSLYTENLIGIPTRTTWAGYRGRDR